MLKNLPPGWMTINDKFVFRSNIISYLRQDDGQSKSSVHLQHSGKLSDEIDIPPREFLERAAHSCGEVLNILKVHSDTPKDVAGHITPSGTYYINRNIFKSFNEAVWLIKGEEGKDDREIHAVQCHLDESEADLLLYIPIQKFIDLMNATSY